MGCKHRAILIITRDVRGTSSSLASGRHQLQCGHPADHDGPHHDTEHDVEWKDRGDLLTHVLRQEEPESPA
jgi:hypothetical protein